MATAAIEEQFEHDSFRLEDASYVPVAALGMMAVMFALVAGIVVAVDVSDLYTASGAGDAELRGTQAAFSIWGPQVALLGAALLMTAVAIILRRIVKTIRLRATATRYAFMLLAGNGTREGN